MTELRPFALVRSIRRYLLFAQSAGVVSIAVGALVLVGWAFDIAVLKSVVPGMTRMKPNTAVCFILLGAALRLFRKKPAQSESVHPRRQVVAQACALLAALIGSVTLVEYLFGFDAGIDKLLFRNALLATKVPFPGRMAHVTGLEFIVLGIALALLNAESLRGQRLSRIFAVVGTLIGLIAIVGYAYGAEELYKISTFSSVALHTALLSTLLGFAILCARADQGFSIDHHQYESGWFDRAANSPDGVNLSISHRLATASRPACWTVRNRVWPGDFHHLERPDFCHPCLFRFPVVE
jgi:hypothetical protein